MSFFSSIAKLACPDDPEALLTIGRKILLVMVFAVFPILVVQKTFRQVENLEVEKIIQKQQEVHGKVLSQLKPHDGNQSMIARSVQRVMAHMAREPLTKKIAHVKRLHNLFPGAMDVFFFNGEGKLIPEISSRGKGRRMLEIAFELLCDGRRGKKIPLEKEGILKQIFNVTMIRFLTSAWVNPVSLAKRDRDGFFAWYFDDAFASPDEVKGYFLLLHPEAFKRNRSLKSAVDFLNRRLKSCQVGFLDLERDKFTLYPAELGNRPEYQRAILESMSRYSENFEGTFFHGSMIMRKGPGYLLAINQRASFLGAFRTWTIHAFCIFWVFFIYFSIPESGRGIAARIPTKLVALFLFAVGTPAMVLLIGGFYSLKDHTVILLKNLERQIQEKILLFDRKFPAETAKLESKMRYLVGKARGFPLLEDRLKVYRKFIREQALDTVIVVDQQGREIFNFPSYKESMARDPAVKKKGEMGLILARELLNRINRSLKMDAGTLLVEAAGSALSSLMGESGVIDFDLIISELGQFREIGYAGDNALFYFDAVSDGKGVAIEAVTGYVSGILLESLYIKSNLKNLLRQSDLKWRVGATCDYLGLMVKHKTSGFSNKILSSPKDEKLCDEICREVQVSRSAVRKIIVNRGNEELWYGTRCQNLTRYTIVTATPLGPLKAHINSLWLLLVSVALMVFLATAIIGALLSEQFLRPIKDLSRGIKSIEERNFTYQVPIHAPDELGEMSVLMNRVIDGMKDLEVARIVQENLFPQEYLDIGGYRIFGKSRAMSDIGGDYFDYFRIEGKIVGVIGDVSGHGVSAALIMGMAKCAFSTDEHLGRSLIENLSSFNRFMLKTIKKKKMMTLFHYCLDTEKNIFYYSNAGHNTPFLWNDRKKESESLQIGGMPLGVRAKTTYEVVEIPLFPGDSIMMYTDGLVEAADRHGGILGYPTAQGWFDDVSQLDSIEMVNRLFKRFEEYTKGTEPNDDVSIICLKRLR